MKSKLGTVLGRDGREIISAPADTIMAALLGEANDLVHQVIKVFTFGLSKQVKSVRTRK